MLSWPWPSYRWNKQAAQPIGADICPHYTLVLFSIFNSLANLSSPYSLLIEGNILGAHSFSVDAGFMEGHPIQDNN